MSPNYRAVIRGIRELHKLTVDRQEDSPAADAVRDATDQHWEALTESERKRASNLSEDLYSITDPCAAVLEMNPQAQAKLIEAYEAKQSGEWDRALDLLRRWGRFIDSSLISYSRGSIWTEAGDLETAVLFYEHASRLQPDSGNYLAIFLYELDQVDPTEARRRAEEILREPHGFPPLAVASAAEIAFKATPTLSAAESTEITRRLITILKSTLMRIEAGDENERDRSARELTVGLLGFYHEFLGEMQAALDYFSRGLEAKPFNEGLLVARGILLYGSSPRAVTDFELAVQRGTSVIWPYFFLAHRFLVDKRFEPCRVHCEKALGMPGSATVKSELSEWMAIAQSELGFPVEMVRASFDNAIRFDPSNQRARRNLAAFEAAIRPLPEGAWETRSTTLVRALGLAETTLVRTLWVAEWRFAA